MAGEIQLNSTTMATESSGTITLSNVNSANNRTNLGLGSMATQDANAVALTGGSLTGTEIDLKSSGTTIYKSDGTTAVLSESGGVVTLNNGTIGSGVVFPGKIIKNIYIDSTGTDTTVTNSSSNKIVYSVSIPNPQTSYSYLIIGGIGGYLDSGEERLFGSLIKDNGLGTQAYIKDTISILYQFGMTYSDMWFFLNLNYYYEPSTDTAFTIDAAIRSDGVLTYRAPYTNNNQFMVFELGGN